MLDELKARPGQSPCKDSDQNRHIPSEKDVPTDYITHKRPQSAKRFDEVRACGDWFANIYYAAQDAARYSPESDDITELSCAYNNTVYFGEPMSPIMALRMPRMVKQPQQWLIDVIRGLGW